MAEKPYETDLGTFEPLPPNPDYVRIIEKIVDQNNVLLKINSNMLQVLTAPMMILGHTVESPDSTEG